MRAIQKAQTEGGKRKYDVSRTLADAGVRGALSQYYGADFLAPDAAVRARAVYANPFAYWLSGLYFSNRPADASDKSRAADFFRLANQSVSGGNYVAASDAAAPRRSPTGAPPAWATSPTRYSRRGARRSAGSSGWICRSTYLRTPCRM